MNEQYMQARPDMQKLNDIVVYETAQRPSLLKPLFIIFNVVAYTAYILAVLSFSLTAEAARSTDSSIKSFY